MKLLSLRAITCVIALCYSGLTFSQNQGVDPAIKKARALLVDGKRLEALTVIKAEAKEGISREDREKLNSEGEKLATFFLTEEGQKLYELGESLSETDPDMAESKFTEALEKEGENTRILNSLAMLHLGQGQCREAMNWVKKSLLIFPGMPITTVIQLSVLECLNDSEEIAKIINSTPPDSSIRENHMFTIFRAREEIKNGKSEEGLRLLRDLSLEKNPAPALWYWRWKLDPEDGQLQSSHLEKYLKICKSMTPRLKRKYKDSGAICTKVEEAEVALKELGVSSDDSSEK